MVKANFYSLFLFFAMNDVIINKDKIIKMFPSQEGKVGGVAYSNEDVKKILEAVGKTKRQSSKKLRTLALVHFLASSGCRVGGVSWLKLADLEPIEDCMAVKVYAKSSYEYVTFLTPQATQALKKYLDFRKERLQEGYILTPDCYVFDLTEDAIRRNISRLLAKTDVTHKTSNGRFDIPVLHGFRKRFNTILKSNMNINPAFIELMMGHATTFTLDKNYLKPTREKLFEEFKKGILDLTL
jgi:integrase